METIKPINSAVREAEKVVIAGLLRNQINPHEASLTGFEFATPEYRHIVLGCLALTQDGGEVDLIALSNYLDVNKAEHKETAPNPIVLARFADHPIPPVIDSTIRLLHANRARTQLAELSKSITEWTQDDTEDPLHIADRVESQLDALRRLLGREIVNYKHVSEIAPDVLSEYEDLLNGISHNIPTGIEKLDYATAGGGTPGDVWVLGAATGQGKSALAFSIARYQASQQIPSLIVSREMRDKENFKRLHSSLSGVPYYLMRPNMKPAVHAHLVKTIDDVNRLPVWLDSDSSDIQSISRNIQHAVEHRGVKSVFVDYVQLLSSSVNKGNRASEVSYICQQLKNLAMKLGIWVFNLAQYNRQAMYSGEAENHSFAESGQIEKDASVILQLALEKVPEGQMPPTWRKATIRMTKGRNAPQQSLQLMFRGETFEFSEGEQCASMNS